MNLNSTTGTESLSFRPWRQDRPPSRMLIIRLHAIGDVAITLPYCAALREQFPDAQIDFLTASTCRDIPLSVTLFDNILVIPFAQQRWRRALNALVWSAKMIQYDYDIVIDLQHSKVSRAVRLAAHPQAWAEFNRFNARPAGERTQDTFEALGFPITPKFKIPIAQHNLTRSSQLLREQGWDGVTKLIVLNPAGLFVTRNWPIEHYAHLAKLWLRQEPVRFLMLGTERVNYKADSLKNKLGNSLINLVGKTSLSEAFAILQYTSGIVSEDSGLMHLAWVSGIPTLTLFGSSPHYWAKPLGSHSVSLDSGDLECGACMQPTCKYGDVHCLTRYTPEHVLGIASRLFSDARKESVPA